MGRLLSGLSEHFINIPYYMPHTHIYIYVGKLIVIPYLKENVLEDVLHPVSACDTFNFS